MAASETGHHYPDPTTRGFIAASCILSTIMYALDGTIANVALPHMQATVSASQEQIVWVLTSFLIATAIATPLSGWMADRFGRKRIMLFSLAGFTLASMACGLSVNLEELVLFRMLQGFCGAGLVPLAQAALLDINPPEKHGQAMALYGMGSILGPIIGPTLGGYITDTLDWRWIFFINVPLGIVAFLGLSGFMSESKADNLPKFDFMGFACLSLFIGSFQLMLDRGQSQDWFNSTEIWIEATIAAVFCYFTVVHMWSARNPFVRPGVFKDRNFSTGMVIAVQLGVLVYGVAALLAPMLQQIMGYPVMLAGLATMPRGVGTMIAMYGVGRLIGRVDPRLLVFLGLVLSGGSMYMFAHMSLEMDDHLILLSGFIQGLGSGLIFVPVTTLMFSTLEPRYRNEGAALSSLARSLGAAMGISYLQTLTIRNAATVQSRLVEGVRPDNPILGFRWPDLDFDTPAQVARAMAEVVRQATMVAYTDSFWFLFVVTIAMIPLLLLMRPMKRAKEADVLHIVMD
ncbi:MAG TPA: DHA2 family efflux MFS transporter permease subunit [Sphingobium sp.]|uniref:DHA2 family efflux MFS transporter permease subunit n=1 Tax=Sphingobium sp. TaxID=1912891 RepID=UPI002ED1F945